MSHLRGQLHLTAPASLSSAYRSQNVPELDGLVGLFAGGAPWGGASGESDLSAGGAAGGVIYEVFHYPVLSRELTTYLPGIYSRHPPRDDFVILMTDFRFDSLYGAATSTGAINHPVYGRGLAAEAPGPGKPFGSSALQVAVRPTWVGQPRFDEVVADGDREYVGHAFAVGLLAHELTHRWGVGLEQWETASGVRRPLFEGAGPPRGSARHLPAHRPRGDRHGMGDGPEGAGDAGADRDTGSRMRLVPAHGGG